MNQHFKTVIFYAQNKEPTYNCAGDVGVRVEIDKEVTRLGIVSQIITQGQVWLKLSWDLY